MSWIRGRSAMHGSAVALVLLISGCGGGGGGGAADPPPTFGSLAFSTKENIDLSGQITATDTQGQTLTYTKMSDPAHGSLTSFSPAGAFAYKPNADFSGSDSFQVQVRDAGGNIVTGTVAITVNPNNPPVANGDVMRADGAALDSIDVKANDEDADDDALTVEIEEAANIGTATVNGNGTIKVAVPGGFKGFTRFRYRITDTSGDSAVGTAAIFVGGEPFRVAFAGNPSGGNSTEVYINDFVSEPQKISAAATSAFRLRGFVVSDNGATVVYRRENSSTNASELYFVKTNAPSTQVQIPLPSGAALIQGSNNEDQFQVSADGKWVTFVAGSPTGNRIYLLDTANPPAKDVSPSGVAIVRLPRFAKDSKTLYFLSSGAASGSRSLYAVDLANPATTAPLSNVTAPGSTDDILDYAVAADQSRILLHANRGGSVGLYFINPVDPNHTEFQLNVPGQTIAETTVSLPPGSGGSTQVERVAYTVQGLLAFSTWVAEVSTSPTPRLIANNARVIGFRPDNDALLYTQSGLVKEDIIDNGAADETVAAGAAGWYDSTGNVVLVKQFLPGAGSSYPALAVASRGDFADAKPVGSEVQASYYINVTGFDRGVAVVGQAAPSATAPSTARLAVVNALAPDKVVLLADFVSPLQMTSDTAAVVGY